MIPLGTDYETFYRKYVPGLRSGSNRNLTGYCPIHGETPGKSKPSLSVNVETGLWYCFAGCGGGSARTFLEALGEKRSVIDREVAQLPKSKKKRRVNKEQVTVLPEKLLGVFDYCPKSLLREGFEEEILFRHDIGYDRELSRITFPVRDKLGQLVGLVGRRKTSDFGKYKVYTSELEKYGLYVPSFSKTDYLWREDKVFPSITQKEDIFVVEGFKAALWFVQAGFENVVALMGSHMADKQKSALLSAGQRVILCLDNDDAGIKASLKISHKLRGIRRLIVPLPGGIHQPDDLTEGELRDVCSTPISISEARRKWQEYL
jgi:DNA primase